MRSPAGAGPRAIGSALRRPTPTSSFVGDDAGDVGAGVSTSRAWARRVGIDTETLEIDVVIEVPIHLHGISIDNDGYVWGITWDRAFKVDRTTGAFDNDDGLTGAYTYGDIDRHRAAPRRRGRAPASGLAGHIPGVAAL